MANHVRSLYKIHLFRGYYVNSNSLFLYSPTPIISASWKITITDTGVYKINPGISHFVSYSDATIIVYTPSCYISLWMMFDIESILCAYVFIYIYTLERKIDDSCCDF